MRTQYRSALAVILFVACTGASAQGGQTNEKTIYFRQGTPIQGAIGDDDRVVVVRKPWSSLFIATDPSPTIQEEINRILGIADAIAIVEVQGVNAKLTAAGDWIQTEVRGTVKELVKVPEHPIGAEHPIGDGKELIFRFDGGEVRLKNAIVRAGSYPMIREGSSYLVMFQRDPYALTWHPFLPARIEPDGTLGRPQVFDPDRVPWDSPIYGRAAKEVIALFKKP